MQKLILYWGCVIILVFLYILIIFIVILIFSTIKLKIDYLKIDKNELALTIYFYLFSKIKYFKFSKKIDVTKAIKNEKYQNINAKLKDNKKYTPILKKINLNIENFGLLINVGIIDVNITNCIVFISSTAISILFGYLYSKPNIKLGNTNYDIKPFYNRNAFQVDLKTTISIKIINIIYLLFLLLKFKRKIKYKKTH